jgi:hypothetical protein
MAVRVSSLCTCLPLFYSLLIAAVGSTSAFGIHPRLPTPPRHRRQPAGATCTICIHRLGVTAKNNEDRRRGALPTLPTKASPQDRIDQTKKRISTLASSAGASALATLGAKVGSAVDLRMASIGGGVMAATGGAAGAGTATKIRSQLARMVPKCSTIGTALGASLGAAVGITVANIVLARLVKITTEPVGLIVGSATTLGNGLLVDEDAFLEELEERFDKHGNVIVGSDDDPVAESAVAPSSSSPSSDDSSPKNKPELEPQQSYWKYRGYDIFRQVALPDMPLTNAPAIILVHGSGYSAVYWRETIKALTGQGYLVHAIDLLGKGRSAAPTDDVECSVALWADLVDRYARENLPGKDIVLIGNSVGSLVSLTAANDIDDGDDEHQSYIRQALLVSDPSVVA